MNAHYAFLKRLVLFAIGYFFLYALLDNEWEPFLNLIKIVGCAGAVLAGYAAVVWVAAHAVRLLIRWTRNSRSEGATQE